MRNDRERLLDIVEAIDKIEKHTRDGREIFESDELVQTWVIHHLEIIGEACRSLSDSFVRGNPDVPWSDIVGMRNILVHQYFGIDTEAVWSVVAHQLPELKKSIRKILG